MNGKYKWQKRLVINCCGNNMKVLCSHCSNDCIIRERFCFKCYKRVYTVQYPNENEKIIDEDIIKKWQQLIKKED